MKIYMAVTADKYELPMYAAWDGVDLAEWAGIKAHCNLY